MDVTQTARKPYPSDVSDDEWAFVAPYLALMTRGRAAAGAPLREVFNGLRYDGATGAPWRLMPNDLPPWPTVYQQTPALAARPACFEAMVHDLRALLRLAAGRATGADGGDLRRPDAPEHARERGPCRVRRAQEAQGLARCTWRSTRLGHLLALLVTPANEQERAQVAELAEAVQEVTGERRRTRLRRPGLHRRRSRPRTPPRTGIRLEVVKLAEAKRGFVLLPRRWVVERDFAWAARFRRLARDYERLPETLAGLHFVAFACLMLQRSS